MAVEWIVFVSTFFGIMTFHNMRHEVAHHHHMANYLGEQYRRGKPLDRADFSAFLTAVGKGDKERALSLLTSSSVHDTSKAGYTALHIAAYIGMENLARIMLERGAEVNAQASDGTTPLILAVATSRTGVVRLLTDFGAEVSLADRNGTTALLLAANNGYSEIVRILTDPKIPKPFIQEDIEATFRVVAQRGDVEVGRYLLKIIQINGEDFSQPLFTAVDNRRLNFVKFLLKAGVPCDSRDFNDRTALHLAVAGRDLSLVKLLLLYKCDPNAKDLTETTPLHISAATGDLIISSLLVRHGANKYAKSRFGVTPMSVAVRSGHMRVYKLLRTSVR